MSDTLNEIYLVLLDNKFAGFAILKMKGAFAGYIQTVAIKPEIRNKGIGKILLLAAEDEARKQNCFAIYMTVISVRTPLIDWYKRHEYYDTGKRQPFDSSDPRFGIPKMVLEFIVLEKKLTR